MPVVARTITATPFSYQPMSIKRIVERRLFGIRQSIAITILTYHP
jgi:hypothetical protein